MNRQAEITLDIGCETKLIRFRSRERLGELFEIDAEIIAADKIDFLPSLGKPAMIELFELGKSVRVFHALMTEAHFVDEENQGYHYALKLRPWLYALARNRAYRIFEDKTGLDIIKEVLADQSRRVDYSRIGGSYQPRKYTTQYRESDFALVSRIMEREGIYYYFEHRRDDHVLVLCDAPSAHKPAPGYETVKLRSDEVGRNGGLTEALWRWHEHVRDDGERKTLLQSFDYQTTSVKKGQYDGSAHNPEDTQEIHEYTGDFVEEALADHWAQVSIEAARARQRFYTGHGDAIGLFCGSRFQLDSDDAFDRGSDFVVTAMDYAVDAEPYRTGTEAEGRHVDIEAVTADTQWRSPIRTPTPRAGPETAIVMVGGADDTNVDEIGRVRVRFLWGKPGEAPEKARSCWLRISYPSASASFGHVTLPRLDEEVIVDFLDSNPDRPIVTGRVYNSQHLHPYALPEHRTRSLYRSQTIGQPGSYAGAKSTPAGPGHNEFTFEDKGGSEQVYLRAQRNRLTEIFLDDEQNINRDRKTDVYRNDTTTVETGDYKVNAEQGNVEIRAEKSITLVVGLNKIVIDNSSINIISGLSKISLTEAQMSVNSPIIRIQSELFDLNSLATILEGEALIDKNQNTLISGDAIGPWVPLPV